jgi:hypothetical protein
MNLIQHPELDYMCKLDSLVPRKATKGIVIHHTASDGSTPESVTRYHTQTNGWHHAGYNILITPDGVAHELRPLEMIGAHAGVKTDPRPIEGELGYNNNRQTVGVSLTGAMHQHKPTREALQTLYKVIIGLLKQYPTIDFIEGHGGMPGCQTACPGQYMPMDEIKAIIDETRESMTGERIAGVTRIETAIEVDKIPYLEEGTVVICNGWSADCPVASVLANKTGCSLLYVYQDSLPESVKRRIKEIDAKNFAIVGGIAAVSSKVEMELRAL